jgi:D-glycero-alpha-D-manno-heptose-7-phosphate kinase
MTQIPTPKPVEPVLEYVTTCAPQRISFVGGGTDLPAFYEREVGAVLSSAIDKNIYVTVKRMGGLFEAQYRLNYSITENVNSLDEMQNHIARECLRLVPVKPPLYIGTVADVPNASGLGSSSCFAVALLKALHLMRGERVSDIQIAEEACYVEIKALNRPVGKQDHYAATFGGLNVFEFLASGQVRVQPLPLPLTQISKLYDHLLLFWTNIQRDAGSVLKEQRENTVDKMTVLRTMRDQVYEMQAKLVTDFSIEGFGQMLHQGWQMKRSLASKITNSQIDAWYDKAIEAGAYGGKLCGAGGGGFLLFVAPPESHDEIRSQLSELKEEPIRFEPHGVRTLIQISRDSNQ